MIQNTLSHDSFHLTRPNPKLSGLAESELLKRTHALVQEERRITLELIEHLREIQARRTHETMGYSSLHAFCVGHLGLSDGAAARRISALQLSRDVPEIKEKIQSGTLSLSSANTLQTFFRNQKKLGRAPTSEDKRSVIARVEGLSRKDTERALFAIAPEAIPKERERVVSPEETELRLVLDQGTYGKLKRLQGYWSHRLKQGTYAELLERLLDEQLEREERRLLGKGADKGKEKGASGEGKEKRTPGGRETAEGKEKGTLAGRETDVVKREATPQRSRVGDTSTASHSAAEWTERELRDRSGLRPRGPAKLSPPVRAQAQAQFQARPPVLNGLRFKPHRPAIQAGVRRAVWFRAGGRCQYVAPDGMRCAATRFLEIDHITPWALLVDKTHSLENLRLLCRAHNGHEAMRRLGPAATRIQRR